MKYLSWQHPWVRAAAWLGAVLCCGSAAAALPGWQPTQPVQIVVPAGTGGGADQMARFVADLVVKHKLMAQPITVVNRPGNSGAEGLLEVRAAAGDPHKLIITLSSLFTTPMATGVDFNWRQLTPLAMLALDPFVVWVKADTGAPSAQALLAALKQQPKNHFKLGGTGSKQEDQIISVLLETAGETRIHYVPLRGGGDVAKALAGGEVDLTVNNPIEAEALWRQGKLRPLCVLDGRPLEYPQPLAHGKSWRDIPTCMSAGIPAQYLMLRGIFAAPGLSAEQSAFYVALLERVRNLPEWREFLARGAFNSTALSGPAFVDWLDKAERYHRVVMREAKLLAAR